MHLTNFHFYNPKNNLYSKPIMGLQGCGIGYCFSFNGKENDNEVKGTGNQQDYGMRIYDNRLGKFLSVDPLTQEYPFYSPYHFAGNSPIRFIDLDGEEPIDPMIYFWALKAIYAFDNWKKESSDMSDGLARGYMAQTGSSNLAFDYSKKYTNGDALAWGMAQMGQSMGAYMSMKSGLKQMNPKPQETNKPNSQEVNKPKIEPVKVQNVKVQETTIPQNRIPAQRVNHVFSDKPGKLNNTTENKSLIETIANNDKNLLGTDKFGLRWYAETRKDNSQIYVSVNKSGEITGAGINTFARPFSAEKGLRIKPERE